MNTSESIIYLVDDDPSFLPAISRLLRAVGYTVRTFASPTEFLKEAATATSGCIVLDLQMPELTGLELQETLAQLESALPIIFLTGHGDVPVAVRAMRRGAEDFLSKRASKEELLGAIERALARNARQREYQKRRREIRQKMAMLTPREREVLTHVIQGHLNKQTAAQLTINERTVKLHRTSLMTKLQAGSVPELMRMLQDADLLKDGLLQV